MRVRTWVSTRRYSWTGGTGEPVASGGSGVGGFSAVVPFGLVGAWMSEVIGIVGVVFLGVYGFWGYWRLTERPLEQGLKKLEDKVGNRLLEDEDAASS